MKKNVASQVVGAQMVAAADGTAFTSAVTVYVTGDGGTQAAGSVGSGACTHEGNGYHTYAPAQAETNYDHVAFTFIGTGAIPATVQTYPTFPQTGDAFARLGAPNGASVSADVAAVKVDTAATLADTGTDGVVVAAASKTGYALSAAGIQAIWDALTSALTTVGSIGKLLVDNINATISSRSTYAGGDITGNLSGSVGSVTGNVGGNVAGSVGSVAGAVGSVTAPVTAGTVSDKTGYAIGVGGIGATAFAAGAIDAAAIAANAIGASELAQDAAQEIADEILNRDIVGGASGGTRNVRSALRRLRNRVAVAAGTATVYQENDTTAAWTAAVTTAAGDPVSEVDPT